MKSLSARTHRKNAGRAFLAKLRAEGQAWFSSHGKRYLIKSASQSEWCGGAALLLIGDRLRIVSDVKDGKVWTMDGKCIVVYPKYKHLYGVVMEEHDRE